MEYQSINPSDGSLLKTFDLSIDVEVEEKLIALYQAQLTWKNIMYADRASALQRLSLLLTEDLERCARIISMEMGKPLPEAKAEMHKCVSLCAYYSALNGGLPEDKEISLNQSKAIIRAFPLGVILGIMPWNFPFWQALRFAIPTIMAGNTVLLKHAPNVPQCALMIEQLFEKAAFPIPVFANVFASHQQVETLLAHRKISGVSLTGSTAAGSTVAALAGKSLKKFVMELGGNDPFILFEDAQLSSALKALIQSRARNAGQSCVAAKRVFIHISVYEQFKAMLLSAFQHLRVGDAFSGADIGPLARVDLAEKARAQVANAIQEGAVLLAEIADIPTSSSCYFKPCILEVKEENSVIEKEEIFAPVFSLIPFENTTALLAKINSGDYGLGASVWTDDERLKAMISEELACGMIYFNEMVYSDPAIPFGGMKKSGVGKELGELGMHEFIQYKTIYHK
jgi:succinate-semialdehyde dehydrogenase/glutarate-semialdehyde dehydrogenase